MFRFALAAFLIGALPGALLFRLPFFDRPRRAALPAEERAFWSIVISVACSLAVVVGLALVGRYSFDRLLVVDGVMCVLTLAIGHVRLLYRGEAPAPSWSALAPVGIVALGMWLYFPPAEFVMGGKDPGVYINEGIQIAQRGNVIVHDAVVASVPPASRDLFFPAHRDQLQWYYGQRFVGFFLQDPNDGSVVGQFPHLFPAAIAIGYGLNGLSGARQTVGVLAILGLLAVYFLAAHLIGRTGAAAAAVLLAINVVEVWFARYPNGEVLMQAFLFASMLAFARATEGSRVFFGSVSAILVTMLLFLRYDVIIAIATLTATAALLPAIRARVGVTFGVWLVAGLAAGLLYLLGPLRAYAAYPLAFIRLSVGWWAVGAGLVLLIATRRLLKVERFATVVRQLLPLVYAAALVALAVYAYFFRTMSGRLALFDAMAFRAYGWYVTPAVIFLGLAGLVLIARDRFWRQPAFFITFATFSVFFFYKTRIVPEHFWATRRYLAVTLPGSMIFVAALAAMAVGPAALSRWFGRGKAAPRWTSTVGAVLVCAALAPVAAAYWRQAAPVRRHVEYAGLIPKLEQLAARIDDRDLLLVEAQNAGSDLYMLAAPLAYIYARNVLVLNSPVPEKRQLEDFVTWAHTRYRDVLFLGGGGTDLLTAHISAEPIAADRFQVPEYENPYNAYPTGPRRKEFEFGLYRVIKTPGVPPAPIDLAIGGLDDLNVVRFHAREKQPDTGLSYRWTHTQSFILLSGIEPTARTLTLWMSNGGRPGAAPPATVTVDLDDAPLGIATPIDGVQPYAFEIPASVAERARQDPIRLRLRVPTWKPAEFVGGNDTRDLGVIVTRVTVR